VGVGAALPVAGEKDRAEPEIQPVIASERTQAREQHKLRMLGYCNSSPTYSVTFILTLFKGSGKGPGRPTLGWKKLGLRIHLLENRIRRLFYRSSASFRGSKAKLLIALSEVLHAVV
jgi:hypothetical protein